MEIGYEVEDWIELAMNLISDFSYLFNIHFITRKHIDVRRDAPEPLHIDYCGIHPGPSSLVYALIDYLLK
jgi:hypothetical protein